MLSFSLEKACSGESRSQVSPHVCLEVIHMNLGKMFKRACRGILRDWRLVFDHPRLELDEPEYDAYWRARRRHGMGGINSFQRWRAEWILPRMEEHSTVLDIGCGDGGVLLYLLERKNLKPVAADVSSYALSFLRSKGVSTIECDFDDLGSVQELPEVDYVILFEVMEHMRNPERFLKLIEPRVRRAIFFSLPNTGYYAYRVRMLLGSFVIQWRLHPGEHARFWTRRDLKWWLNELEYGDRSEIAIYEGVPLLNRVWGGLFGMAFVGEIKTVDEKRQSHPVVECSRQ